MDADKNIKTRENNQIEIKHVIQPALDQITNYWNWVGVEALSEDKNANTGSDLGKMKEYSLTIKDLLREERYEKIEEWINTIGTYSNTCKEKIIKPVSDEVLELDG